MLDPATGEGTKLELGADWRSKSPVDLIIGPVLHPDDAVANKVCALYGRAEARDYIDVHGALVDGRYTGDDLLRLAAEHDAGFEPSMFAEALNAVRRFGDPVFKVYGLSAEQAEAMKQRLLAWATEMTA